MRHAEVVSSLLGGDVADSTVATFQESDWQSLIHYVGNALILPSFAIRTRDKPVVDHMPDAATAFLHDAHLRNRERNQQLLGCYERLLTTLNAAGIMPVPLKGVALIATGPYDDIGERMLADIDVLIHPHELQPALWSLRDGGYSQHSNVVEPRTLLSAPEFLPLNPDDFRNSLHYCRSHVPVIVDDQAGFTIELHVTNGATISEAGLYLNSFAQSADQMISFGGGQHRVSSDVFKLLNVFYASQLKDRLQSQGRIDWRHLIDAEMLMRHSCSPELVEECFVHARHMGSDNEFFTFLEQVRRYVAYDLSFDRFATVARQRHAQRFFSLSVSPVRRQFATLFDQTRSKVRSMSLTELRRFHGPVALPVAIYRRLRYQLHKVLVNFRNRWQG